MARAGVVFLTVSYGLYGYGHGTGRRGVPDRFCWVRDGGPRAVWKPALAVPLDTVRIHVYMCNWTLHRHVAQACLVDLHYKPCV